MLDVYRQCRTAPLPLLEGASRAFANRYEPNDPIKAFKAARAALDRLRGRNAYVAYVLGSKDPFLDQTWTDAFEEATLRVYGSFFQHRSEA